MHKWAILIVFQLLLFCKSYAIDLDSNFSISIYNDIYYQNDFNTNLRSSQRLPYLYNHNRVNSISINQALVSFGYHGDNVRSTIALQAGTYANDNYGIDSNYKYIFEANAGFALGKTKKLWIDAGILPSYLGFESALSSKNLTLSRSLSAENSPYYLMGIYATYQYNDHWKIRGIVNNGWQQIVKPPPNGFGYGLQIQYKQKNTTVNYGNFYGHQSLPKIVNEYRFFNNFYVEHDWKKFSLKAGVDYGNQQSPLNRPNYYHHWYAGTLIGRYSFNEKLKLGGRVEYYSDNNNVIVDHNTAFEAYGTSLNLDYYLNKNVLLRLEPRVLFVSHVQRNSTGSNYKSIPSIMASFAIILP